MKNTGRLFVYLFSVFPILAICLVLIITGKVSISYSSGFGVDSSGILYLGTDTEIKKIYNGETVASISPQTSRGYMFTVQKDDTILLSTGSYVYVTDLSGNVINEKEDPYTRTFNELQSTKNKFIASDNREYVMRSRFGRKIIYSGDEVIYKMPLADYIVKIVFVLIFSGFIVFISLSVKEWYAVRKKMGREAFSCENGSAFGWGNKSK